MSAEQKLAKPLKRYLICIDGFEPHERIAETASKARYADWRAAADVGYFAGRDGFRAYLDRASTLHLGPAEAPRP